MKKIFRVLAVSALALAMLLSFVACSNLEMGTVEDALEELAEDEDDYFYADYKEIKNKFGKKAADYILTGLAEIDEMKGDIESMVLLGDNEMQFCLAVEFEKSADAKKVAKNLEDDIDDVVIAAYMAYYKDICKEAGLDYDKAEAKEEAKESVDEIIPKKFIVERQGNIVFCGEKSIVNDVLEAVKDAK